MEIVTIAYVCDMFLAYTCDMFIAYTYDMFIAYLLYVARVVVGNTVADHYLLLFIVLHSADQVGIG